MCGHVIYGERTFSPVRRRHELHHCTDVTYVIYAGDVTYAAAGENDWR
jgi:hypothetical protein